MVFSDLDFLLLFLPVTILGFYAIKNVASGSYAVPYLLCASAVFYSAWSTKYLALLAASVCMNYALSRVLVKAMGRRTLILAIGVGCNLALLGFFKYFHFATETMSAVTGYDLPMLRDISSSIVLPLGVSFFTFQQIAYLVDTARETRPQCTSREPFANYSLFVVLFPHLIAGPIVRHSEVSRQIAELGRHRIGELQSFGTMIFAVGLAKKVLIADPLSPLVARCFDNSGQLEVMTAWLGLLAYTFQLYFDFSGYSDMAVGLAATFGIVFPMNFDRPYLSRDIQEFWRRWHITLSRFLRDYLYIPLGGNRGQTLDVCVRIVVTMVLGGLWHGAGWTFVLWGAYHGMLLSIHRVWKLSRVTLHQLLAWPITIIAVVLGWVLFRSKSVEESLAYYMALVGLGDHGASASVSLRDIPAAFWLAAVLMLIWDERLPVKGRFAVLGAIGSGLLVWLCVSSGGEISEFLYFQF